jgi:predicted DNA binding CopG/RHH family protein
LLTQLRSAACSTGQKDQRINIRLSSPDLQALRARALQEGIPYQTLISSVLHKYISGALRKDTREGSRSPKHHLTEILP